MKALLMPVAVVALLIEAGAQAPAPQSSSAPKPSALILGRVVDASTDKPISSVVVTLSGAGVPRGSSALTDAQGRFVFRNVPKGDMTLRATIGGNGYSPSGFFYSGLAPQIGPYLDGGYGQRRPGGPLQTLDLGEGERLGDLVIKLWKGGSIDGLVLDEAGEPLVNVLVAATKRSSDGRLLQGPLTSTDDRGAYHLGTLVPGDYLIVVPQMQALMPTSTADALASAPPTDRSIGSVLANTGGASVAGGLVVGNQRLIGDRTAFDLPSNLLPPVPRGPELFVYQTTFAPSATLASKASAITVQSGETRTGVTVQLQPVRGVVVSGTVTDDSGPVPNFGVRLMPADAADESNIIEVARTSTDGSGRFTLPLVPVGWYRLIARRETTTARPDASGRQVSPPATRVADRIGASAEQVVTVAEGGLSGVALQLRPGVSVRGHLEFRGTGNRPPAEAIQQSFASAAFVDPVSRLPNVSRSNRVDANDAFEIQNLPAGRYTINWNDSVPGWTMSELTVGGRPMLGRGIVIDTADLTDVTIVLTDRPAEISGTVRTRDGVTDSSAGVYLFPTDRTLWHDARRNSRSVRVARVSRKGEFRVTSVPPGEYAIVAIADEQGADFPDEKCLALLAAVAKTVTVGAGEKPVVQLTTATVPSSRGSSRDSRFEVPPARRAAPGPFVEDLASAADLTSVIDGDQALPTVAAGSLSLSGVVTTDASAAQPLRRVLITVTGAEILGSRQAVTDDDGAFRVPDLPPGRYSIVAEKPGYVKAFLGSKRPGRPPASPVDLEAGKPLATVTIRMMRGAVIAGTVRDQFGTPMASAQVTLKQPLVVNGARQMVDVLNVPIGRATSDDQGRYRFYGLPPGEYSVFCGSLYNGVRETTVAEIDAAVRDVQALAASRPLPAPDPRPVTVLSRYLPGVPTADAAEILTLAAGEERLDADFATRMVHVVNVSGMSFGPDGAPATNALIGVVNAGERTTWTSPGSVRPGPDGTFSVLALQPGRWALVGRAGNNGAPESQPLLLSGEVEFVVADQDVTGIVLQFERGVTVSGRVMAQSGATPPDLANARLTLANVGGLAAFTLSPPPASVKADGTFQFPSVGPGKWRLGATLPGGWSLRSATFNGRDTLDVPLEVPRGQAVDGLDVTITNRPATITGTLRDAQGRPTSAYSMLAFSTDRSLWTTAARRISGAVRLSSDGKFRIVGLPPGEYYLSAISDFEPQQLGDPAFLDSLISQAVRVTLVEGEARTQDLRVGG